MRRAFREMNVDNCRAKLALWIPSSKFNVILKCWDLPQSSRPLRTGHCGNHTEIMRCCIESPTFKTLLHDCRAQVEEVWQVQDIVTVLCVCSSGMHRSVAVASALQSIYQMEGFTSMGPCHLDIHRWRALCSACSHCVCNKDKDKMFESFVVDHV